MMKRNILLTVVVILVIVVAGFALLHGRSAKQPAATTTATTTTPPTTAVIEITPTGFIPKTLAVKPNTNITWVNEDTLPHLPAADPYPSHKSLPSLVAPMALGKKETYTFLVTKTETIKYHDDLRPTWTGVIDVR